MNMLNIGLDIDGVLADFTRGWNNVYPDAPAMPDKYNYDPKMGQRFKAMKAAGTLDDFFLSLEPLFDPKDLPFIPKGYVTARPVETNVTEQWLTNVGFPKAKGPPVEGKIIYVANEIDAASGTQIVRVEIPNPSGRPAGKKVFVRFSPADKTEIPINKKGKSKSKDGWKDRTWVF